MSHEFIAPSGQVLYRTKLLRDFAKVTAFAACLRANSRFDNVEIITSAKAKGNGWFVQFRPINESRNADLYLRQHEARAERARREGAGYQFVRATTGDFYYCWSLSGEVYDTSDYDCSCPDYEFRCKRAGLACKHMIALRLQLAAGMAR